VINGVLQGELERPEKEHRKERDRDCITNLEML